MMMIISWPSPQTPNTEENTIIPHVTSMTFTRMVELKQMIFIFIITIVASPVLATELEVVFIIRIMQWPCGHCSYNTLLLIMDHSRWQSSGRLLAQVWLCLGKEVCRWHLWWVVTSQPSYNMIIMIKTIIHDDYDVFCFLAYQEVCSGFTTITGFYR